MNYRNRDFLLRWAELEKNMLAWNSDGSVANPGLSPSHQLILLTHDESTFYANDRCKTQWMHCTETAQPKRKGEGASIMVSDFCSLDIGWLKSSDGLV